MRRDRLLLERERLLFQQQVVLFERIAREVLRPLRIHQVACQRAVELGHFESRHRRDIRHLVVGGGLVRRECHLEGLALLREALLQRRRETHATEGVTHRCREGELGVGREKTRTVGARGPCRAIGADDLALPELLPHRIAALARRVREALAHLDRLGHRGRVVGDELFEHGDRSIRTTRLLVKVGGLHRRLAAQRRLLAGGGGDALELGRGLAGAPRFRVGHREAARHLRLQLVLGKITPERFEHGDRAIPGLLRDEKRRGIVGGGRTDLRIRRHRCDTQEGIHRTGRIARGTLRLGLLVDRSREALGQVGTFRIAGRRECARVDERDLCLVEIQQVEIRPADDRPADALPRRIDRRLARQQGLGHCNRARQVPGRENILRRARQHAGAVRMLGERGRKLHARIDRPLVDGGPPGRRQALLMPLQRHESRVTGGGRLRVLRVIVGRALVFRRRIEVLAALEQRFREQIVGARRIRVIREGLQVVTVPARGLLVVLDFLRGLRTRVVVLRHILEIRLQLGDDPGIVRTLATDPEAAGEPVALDEFALAVEHQIREPALLVCLDRLHRKAGGVFIVRIAVDERPIGRRGVLVALLVDIEIAEPRVQQVRVGRRAVLCDIGIERCGAVEIRERDRHDPQGIVDEFAVRARERIEALFLRGGTRLAQHRIEHATEGLEALLVARLLEQRPAVLVEALFVERGSRAELHRLRIGRLGIAVALRGKEHFAAPELDLVEVRGRGIAAHDFVERGERLLGLAGRFVGARELVEHLVVARVVRVGLEQGRIQRNRFRTGEIDRRDLVLHAFEFTGLEVQVAEPAQRLRPQRRVGILQFEESPVVLHCARRTRRHGGALLHVDRPRTQVLDRRRRRGFLRAGCRGDHRHGARRAQREQAAGHGMARAAHRDDSVPGGGAPGGTGAGVGTCAGAGAEGALAARS
ncbi:MAG: hypothetical protein CMLOHMNK_02421 [Steroidobacteraceae bacterium]|nr:hypothetical protein [Steroidobacteraceae bacterium]